MNKSFSVPAVGRHLLVDFWGAGQLSDPVPAKPVLERAAKAAGAVVLEVKLHDFGDRAGFTGVALLAESHISIHTWPEHGYAAIDVFMCGDCDPLASVDVLRAFFAPDREDIQQLKRGMLTEPAL